MLLNITNWQRTEAVSLKCVNERTDSFIETETEITATGRNTGWTITATKKRKGWRGRERENHGRRGNQTPIVEGIQEIGRKNILIGTVNLGLDVTKWQGIPNEHVTEDGNTFERTRSHY